MNSNKTSHSENDFSFSNLQNLSLTIEVGFRSFTACVLDKKSKQVKHTEHFNFTKIDDIFQNSKTLNYDFEEVDVAVTNTHFTLVPAAIYEDAQLDDYHSLNFSNDIEDIKRTQDVADLKSTCVYTIEKEIFNAFTKKYKQANFSHSALAFYQLSKTYSNGANTLVLMCYESGFYIAHFKPNSLDLLNFFEFKSTEDFIYLLLFLAKELSIKQEDLEIIFFGNLELKKSIEPYFKSVKCPEKDTISNLSILASFVSQCVS